jgi:uncharacterized membrane protein YozB (DUF420 family)
MRRARDVVRHRRLMLGAVALVLLFLITYVFKVALLGRENLAEWQAGYRYALWFHETCVLSMVLGGAVALTQAVRLRLRALASDPAHAPDPGGMRLHRRAGWTAVVSATLAVVSAAVVLLGMYGRL